MGTINLSTAVSLTDFAEAIASAGKYVTIIGAGEPGAGKSATLKLLANRLPEYEPAYIDCTLLDLGDFALPYVVEENGFKITKFAPNARFKLHTDKPVLIMLDEIGKAMKSVKNVLLTLMLEKRIGDHYLHPDSIVFGTTNLLSDGLGDVLEAHARNRVCMVQVRKPNAEEWVDWGIANEISPEILAFVKQFPQVLSSYLDGSQKDNAYIFNPLRAGGAAFVTPRSLEKASHAIKQRGRLGSELTLSLLAGTLGESAARDLTAYLTVQDDLPSIEDIFKNPEKTPIPKSAVAKCVLLFSVVSSIKLEDSVLETAMTYIKRLDAELQALFFRTLAQSRDTDRQRFFLANKAFRAWAMENSWIYAKE